MDELIKALKSLQIPKTVIAISGPLWRIQVCPEDLPHGPRQVSISDGWKHYRIVKDGATIIACEQIPQLKQEPEWIDETDTRSVPQVEA